MNETLIAIVIGYALGAIPFGLVCAKVFNVGDIRKIGSGNIGATNVLRTGNKFAAVVTLGLDVAKGVVAVGVAKYIGGDILLAAMAASVGHIYPIWLSKGGKGVAVYVGTIVAVEPIAAGVFAVVWVGVAVVKKYSSLASLSATICVPIVLWMLDQKSAAIVFWGMTALTWYAHKENIIRLVNKSENKIKWK